MKLLLTVLALWLAALPAQAASNNILFIISDDFGVPEASFYRRDLRRVTTPTAPPAPELQALANQGITFSRAWATPWCSATRASIITGQYGFRHGIGKTIDQGSPDLPDTAVTLPRVVGDSSRNYVTRHIGKWHITSENDGPRNLGWQNGINNPPTEGGFPSPRTYFDWRSYTNGSGPTTRSTYALTFWIDEAISTINSANAANRPYFIWLAINNPHAPFHEPPTSLYTTALPGSPTNRQLYGAMVEAMDKELGRLLNNVDLATTTVIFVGDNGTPTNIVSSPYSSTHGKGTIYQEGVRVPLIIAGQGVSGRGYVEAMVNAVDIFPTIVELAGQAGNSRLSGLKIDGVSMVPYFTNPQRPSLRKFAYAEEFVPNYNSTDWQRVIRDTTFSLIERQDGTREFYNLATDPLQTTNILSRTRTAAEAAALATLDAQLDALLATR